MDSIDMIPFHSISITGNRLGKGASGVVYEATCGSVKMAAKWFKCTQSFNREINVLKRLFSCPNVVNVVSYDSVTKIVVLERFGQSDLFDYINEKKPDAQDCIDIMRQVVSATRRCRDLGVWHTDIKDENILIDDANKSIKLIDFETSVDTTDLGRYRRLGTLEYNPPEVLKMYDNHFTYTEPWHVWTLGILFYDLIAGDIPFESPRAEDYEWDCRELDKMIDGLGINKQANSIMKDCLREQPCDRITLDELFARLL